MKNTHIKWALSTLNELGYQLKTTKPQIILDTAWSAVCRFQTNLGLIYLKKVPSALSLEANVILLLQKQFNAPVPKILAHNQELHCFLMQDAGIPLHEVFKQEFKPNFLIDAMHHDTMLQINSADKISLFLDLGVPDWRLPQLPSLYHQLMKEEELLIGDGLTQAELKQLINLESKVQIFCDQLVSFKVPDTFGHADFHDKNILVHPNTHQTTLIDLGEVVITHPFFSFVNCLYRATENLKLQNSQYRKLQEDCFRNWLSIESSAHLYEIITIIEQCWAIHAVLGEYRLIKSIDPIASTPLRRQGRFAGKLRIWIEQSTVI